MPSTKQRFVVKAPCPSRDVLVATHAHMTSTQFQHYRGTLFYWCRACSRAHSATEEHLQLFMDGRVVEPTALIEEQAALA